MSGFGEKWNAYEQEVNKAKKDHLPVPEMPEELAKHYIDVRFSSTADLMSLYGDINRVILSDAEKEFNKEKQGKLVLKDKEIAEAYKGLGYMQAGYVAAGLSSGNEKYDKLVRERGEIDRSVLDKETVKYIIDPSFVYIPKKSKKF